MPESNVLEGIAVIIDDEVYEPNTDIYNLVQQIEGKGIPCLKYKTWPDDKEISNLKGISFVLLDWDLRIAVNEDTQEGELQGPRAVQAMERLQLDFIEKIQKAIFTPIFLFSQVDIDSIKRKLRDKSLYDEEKDNLLFIESKRDLTEDRLFGRIEDWVQGSPTVHVAKEWEKENSKAINKLFIEFYNLHKSWPTVLWNTFKDDNVNPSWELGEVLTKNVHSRMAPLEFEDSLFEAGGEEISIDDVRKVLEGERFISTDNLHKDSAALGDVFKDGKYYYINVRPDCDCIAGRDKNGNRDTDKIELYLIRGYRLKPGQESKHLDEDYGKMRESDNNTIIFNMLGGKSFDFRFKDLNIVEWGKLKDKRIGRLLPPYVTRLHQRYAYYLQRPGIPKIPKGLKIPKVDEPVTGP